MATRNRNDASTDNAVTGGPAVVADAATAVVTDADASVEAIVASDPIDGSDATVVLDAPDLPESDLPECAVDAGPAAPRGETHRTCALSRERQPVDSLIRFVSAPDGTVLPDVVRKLPGRGVWISGDRASITEAARRNVFARGLKRRTIAPPDLADRVETLLVRRVIDALALANKAGLVVTGFTKVDAMLASGQAVALLHGNDASRDGADRLDRKLRAVSGRPDAADVIVTELTTDEMSLAIGRPNVVHASLGSGGATARLLEHAKRLRRFREPRARSH